SSDLRSGRARRKPDHLRQEPPVLAARCTMKWRPSPTAFSPGAAPRRSCALERRAFLKALGSSVVALPFVEVLANSVAHAADDQPLKFIGVYHPHGIAAEYWAMRPEDTETDFDITYEKDRKSTRLNSSHVKISYAVFCLKKKKK